METVLIACLLKHGHDPMNPIKYLLSIVFNDGQIIKGNQNRSRAENVKTSILTNAAYNGHKLIL